MSINKNYQKELFLDQLNFILECKENGTKIELIFTDELVCDYDMYDFEMFKIAYDYCEDKEKAKDEMENYILKGSAIQIIGKINANEKIENILIIVQFLHQISQKKYLENKDDYDEALKIILLGKAKYTITVGNNRNYFDLIPVVSKSDKFGKWSLDPLFGILKVFVMFKDKSILPNKLKLDPNTNIEIKTENVFEENFRSDIEIFEENHLIDLSEFFLNILQLSKEEAIKLKEIMNNMCILNVEELNQLHDDQWKRLSDLAPSKVYLIREKLETLGDVNKSNSSPLENKSYFQLLSDWHKVKRCLFFKAKMQDKLKSTGFLDIEALHGAIDHESKNDSFNFDLMLNKLKESFEPFTIEEKAKPLYSRGMLLFGPPGTGKTSIMNIIIRTCGLTNLVPPISSSEINRGLVGESEALIRDIFGRSRFFPYLLCCIAIDEIESMVPDRSKDSQTSKADNVNQLLALIGGASDIPNNYVIGATNHKSKMDEAFLRRLREKFFVGYLNGNERLALIKSLMNNKSLKSSFDFFDSDIENLVQTITINFSGSATNDFKNKIKNYILIKKNTKLNKEILLKLAEEVAQANDIQIAGQTIPSFVSSQNLDDIIDISQNIDTNYTGRVVINLNESCKNIEFELIDRTLDIFDLKNSSINSIRDIMPILLKFTIRMRINYIKLIDSNFTAKTSKSSDSSSSDSILGFLNDFSNFTEGIVVFDGDTVIGTSMSGTTETRFDVDKFSKSLNDSDAWQKGLLAMFDQKKSKNEIPKKWHIFSTKEEFIIDKFKRDVNFPLTEREKSIKDVENENKNKDKICINCGRYYIEDNNTHDSCTYHPNKLMCLLDDSVELTKDELKELFRINRKEDILKEYKYFCCMSSFENEGCKKSKHSETNSLINNKSNLSIKSNTNRSSQFITIKSAINGKYICADNNEILIANRDIPLSWETFQLIFHDDQIISILSIKNGLFVCAENSGNSYLIANRSNMDSWEKFILIKNSNGTYSFKAIINSMFVSTEANGLMPLIANKEHNNTWEQFCLDFKQTTKDEILKNDDNYDYKFISLDHFALRSVVNEKYVSVDENDILIASRDSKQSWETFQLIYNDDNTISLKSLKNELFVCAENNGNESLVARTQNKDDWEKFYLISNKDNTISLKAKVNNKYVCAENFGFSPLISNKSNIGSWESFYLERV